MPTVHVGSVGTLQDCLRSSVPIKFLSQKFYLGDLMSCHFHDLLIISLWGKYENVSQCTGQWNHPILSGSWPLTPSEMIWVQLTIGVTGRSPEAKWGLNQFFANKSWQDGNRDAQMVPNDIAHWAALEHMHIGLLESWPDLDLTWTEVKFWNWLSSTCFEPAML